LPLSNNIGQKSISISIGDMGLANQSWRLSESCRFGPVFGVAGRDVFLSYFLWKNIGYFLRMRICSAIMRLKLMPFVNFTIISLSSDLKTTPTTGAIPPAVDPVVWTT
jgi:hypothetical protein